MATATPKSLQGALAYHAGRSAELSVTLDYERRGFVLARERWRGRCGEIDLIMRDGDALIFVEVKKSQSLARAAERVTRSQMKRIYNAAEEFLLGEPKGTLTDVRFDVALVDKVGQLRIIENAFGYD